MKIFSAEADNDEVEEDSSEDDKKKKKKREAPKSLETVKGAKKESESFKWSNIFGLDRKKKSTGLIFHPLDENDRRRKRCGSGECTDEPDYSRWSVN